MFAEKEEIAQSQRHRQVLVAEATSYPWLTKYLDREFDREVIAPDAPENNGDNGLPWIMLSTVNPSEAQIVAEKDFADRARENGGAIILRLPPVVIGTGMTGLARTLARGVARGTMLTIRDNDAQLSAIHAVDVARVARLLASAPAGRTSTTIVEVAGPTVRMNDLIEALGVRIKDKRVESIKPFWAKALYGKALYGELTATTVFDNTTVLSLLPADFEFINPAEYLKTHVYDHESL